MSLHRQPITVAIVDVNRTRRASHECLLQSKQGIALLSDVTSGNEVGNVHAFVERRSKPRMDVTASEDAIARIKRLNPLVLLVDVNQSRDEDYALLLLLRCECPDALMVLLADNSIRKDQLLKFLQIGARGYLKYEMVQQQLSKAVQAVGRGEAWVPRQMQGNILDHMLG